MKAIFLAASLLCSANLAFAHGGEDHSKHKVPSFLAQQQMPWGIAAKSSASTRTIEIVMSDDMRFTPSRIEIKKGEVVRFVVKNAGQIQHEMVIGTKATLDEHAEMMLRHPGMEHDEPYQAHVAGGKTGELTWKFNRVGEFDFACLIAGHYQAGMLGTIAVSEH